jgi:hypothetical protein
MAVMDCVEIEETRRTRELPNLQAERMGVHKRNRYGLVLECRCCGTSWSNTPDEFGEFPRDFWVCPARCNM